MGLISVSNVTPVLVAAAGSLLVSYEVFLSSASAQTASRVHPKTDPKSKDFDIMVAIYPEGLGKVKEIIFSSSRPCGWAPFPISARRPTSGRRHRHIGFPTHRGQWGRPA